MALSSHPTFAGRPEDGQEEAGQDGAGHVNSDSAPDAAMLEPRHVDLRVFVYATGDGPHGYTVADLALTRVAPAGSMVVNSSRGGGAKDTWIFAPAAGEPGKGGA